MDDIWFQNPDILFKPEKLTEFIPRTGTKLPNQLNSLVRFSIYLAVILFLYNFVQGSVKVVVFYLPIFMMVLTYFLFRFHPNVENFQVLDRQPVNVIAKTHIVPKKNNPFMNPLVTDYGKKQKKIVASPELTPVKKEMEHHFNQNLYHDIEDVFSRNHSQRQFYTTPSTSIPNDQENFAKWLYGGERTCKEEKLSCQSKW
tara:strand:- start:629 stop:1228 length:600 start_codon:yes stop_codon:yes gene_type:complete